MPGDRRRSLVAVLVVLSVTLPAAAGSQGAAVDVTAVAYTGDGMLDASDERLELWQSGAHEFTATVETRTAFEGAACLVAGTGEERTSPFACENGTLPANGNATVSMSLDGWPEERTGPQNVSVVILSNGTTITTGERNSLVVLRKSGDLDDDGLENERELAVGSRLRTADSDGDGLDDGSEVHTYGTSPTNADTDGDGLDDDAEIERHNTDPTKPDTDGDGLPDARELAVGTNPNKADTDGDGLDDAVEVNTYETNPTKADTDGDGLGDGAEIEKYETNPTATDTDDDGLGDALEVNTYGTDPNTVDTDGDGLSDGVEVDTYQTDPTTADTDGDGLTDGEEINTYGTSPTNADTDDDGLEDGPEVHQYGTDPTTADTDGDGRSDRAEVDPMPWGHLPLPVIVLGTLATVMTIAGGVLYRSDRDFRVALPRPRSWREDSSAEPRATPSGLTATETATEEVPPEFLSNEERIERLLEDNEGRMRQAEIVERTGWSKSKVSRVLTDMADDDRVVKVDIGKGNVITVPERVPSGAESPFEE